MNRFIKFIGSQLMSRALFIVLLLTGAGSIILSQGIGTPATLRVRTDANGYLLAAGAAQTNPVTSSTFANTRLRTDASGNLLVATTAGSWSGLQTFPDGIAVTGGTIAYNKNAIATTSADGILVSNATAATALATQQYSPRIKFCGAGWNSSGSASQTDCWGVENRPQTVAGTTTQQYYWTSSINGGAFTDVMSLTSGGNLTISTLTGTQVNMTSGFRNSANGTTITMPADGEVNFRNNATSGFVSLKVASDIIYSWGIPTITSGFSGTTPSIAGKTSAFAVTIAATPGVTGVVAFNMTWSNIPSVTCSNTITNNIVQAVPTTTTVTLNGVWLAGDVIRCIVLGY